MGRQCYPPALLPPSQQRPVTHRIGGWDVPRVDMEKCVAQKISLTHWVSNPITVQHIASSCRLRLKCDVTRAETRFRLSAKRASPFKSAGGRQFSRLLAAEVCAISGSNAGYAMFRGSVKGTGYPLHSPVSLHFRSHASPCAITFQLESTDYAIPAPKVSREEF